MMLPFDTDAAHEINAARLTHLAGLGLDLTSKRVYEPGCGIGLLTGFWEERGCTVVSSDGRAENVAENLRRHPYRAGQVYERDVCTQSAAEFAPQDIVFCYGLLYHVDDCSGTLAHLAECGAELIFLESIVLDRAIIAMHFVSTAERLDSGIAHAEGRPSPAYLSWALCWAGWTHVYAPVNPPQHPDYLWTPQDDGAWRRGGHNLRVMRVGSRTPLDLPTLREV